MPKYFIYPFSDSAGNRASIPDDTQVTQDVSYQQGFTPPYSEVGGKNVPRLSVNQVLYDATSNLQFWQQNLYPDFITAADNDGISYPYAALNTVKYSGITYQSLTDTNTQLPTNPLSWAIIDRPTDTSLWIKGVSFEASVVSGDIVAYNHNTQLYQKAVANGSYLSYAVGVADITNNRILNKGFYSGFSGLTPGALYYLTNVVANAGQIVSAPPDNQYNNVIIGSAQSSSSIFIDVEQSQNLNTVKQSAQVTNSTQISHAGATTAYLKIPFDTVVVDNASLFNTTTDKFVIPSAGQYLVTISVLSDTLSTGPDLNSISLDVQVNYSGTRGTSYPNIFSGDSFSRIITSGGISANNFSFGLSFSRVLSLSAGDTLEAFCQINLQTGSTLTVPVSLANAFCISKYN